MPDQPAPPPPAPIDGLPAVDLTPPDPAARARPTLLRGASLVDTIGGTIQPNTDLLLRDGRVEQAGRGLAAERATVVDLRGRFVMPGLIDLHVHPGMMVGLRMDPNGQSAERIGRDLQVWLRYGVTTVQAMGSDRVVSFELQREQRNGRFLGSRLFSVGHGFGVQGGVPPFQMDPPGPVRLDDPAAIRRQVDALAALGASGVKIWYDDWYGQFPKMALDVARAIVESCLANGLTSYAHVYRVDDARLLIRAGLRILAHMPRDREADAELIDLMRASGAAVIPTLTVPESNVVFPDRPAWLDDPAFARFLPPGSAEYLRDERVLAAIRARPEFPALAPDLERALRNVALLYQGGVRFGFGTDAGVSNRVVGWSEHRELELLVQAGLPAAAALRMATTDSAALLGQPDLGRLEPGCRADLLVLRANPLEAIANTRTVEAVWFGGQPAGGPL